MDFTCQYVYQICDNCKNTVFVSKCVLRAVLTSEEWYNPIVQGAAFTVQDAAFPAEMNVCDFVNIFTYVGFCCPINILPVAISFVGEGICATCYHYFVV